MSYVRQSGGLYGTDRIMAGLARGLGYSVADVTYDDAMNASRYHPPGTNPLEVKQYNSAGVHIGTTDYSTGSPAYIPEEVRRAHPVEFLQRWVAIFGHVPVLPYMQTPVPEPGWDAIGYKDWWTKQGPYAEANIASNAARAVYVQQHPELLKVSESSTTPDQFKSLLLKSSDVQGKIPVVVDDDGAPIQGAVASNVPWWVWAGGAAALLFAFGGKR